MTGAKTTTLLGIAVILSIVVALILSLSANNKRGELISISSFDECKAAGYPIMESYPEQCATPDGRTFVNESQVAPPAPVGTSTVSTNNVGEGCIIGGCSAQICGEAADGSAVSNCEYKAEYGCYKTARCEKQTNGKCGWTQSAELKVCLANPPKQDSQTPQVF